MTFAVTATGRVNGVVDLVEYLDADNVPVVECGPLGKLTVPAGGKEVIGVGDTVGMTFAEDKPHCFDPDEKPSVRVNGCPVTAALQLWRKAFFSQR